MTPVLEARNLSVSFKNRDTAELHAVNDVSFELFSGEILGIVGKSGSGKSTLSRAISGLTPIADGFVFIEGEEVAGRKGGSMKKICKSLQMVFQNPTSSFDPRRTLGDGIAEGLRNRGASRADATARVHALLAQCGLGADFADRYPHEVSGGECQRAAIARALAINPKILICDEATSALDVTVQQQVIALLQALHAESGMSFIFISHNLALVQMFCTRVLVMAEGKIVEEGTPDDIIMYPKTTHTKLLIDAIL